MPKRKPRSRQEAELRYRGAVGALRGQMQRNLETEMKYPESTANRGVSVYSLKRAITEYETAVKHMDRFEPGFRDHAMYEPRHAKQRIKELEASIARQKR